MENIDTKTIEVIIQGGAVGLTLASFGIISYLIGTLKKLLGNHIDHNTEALKDLTTTLAELKQFLVDNKK